MLRAILTNGNLIYHLRPRVLDAFAFQPHKNEVAKKTGPIMNNLLSNWQKNTPELVIHFTGYDLPARKPADLSPDKPAKDWSLMNRINQKGLRPQDKPILITELTNDEKALISGHHPELII